MSKKIVSVSLGSSSRDHAVRARFEDQEFEISRRGTDGDLEQAERLLRELDGTVDAIGLGGIDIYLYSGTKRYEVVDGARLRDCVKKTPVVDGSGLKNSLEPEAVRQLASDPWFNPDGKTVLMVSAVDRFGMAKAFSELGAKTIFGDLIFALGVRIPVYTLEKLASLADEILPKMIKAPFHTLYPVGQAQEAVPDPKYSEYYDQADIIAGDFHYIRRYMPPNLAGKIILTNTVTAGDVDSLKERGVTYLITTTPEFEGRSFGTNVLEAVFLTLIGKPWEETTEQDYLDLLQQLDYRPRVKKLAP